MHEPQREILRMLQDGIISAEEANRLLAALGRLPEVATQEEEAEQRDEGEAPAAGESGSAAPAGEEAHAASVAAVAASSVEAVLQQLQAGQLSAEEANVLLAAQEGGDPGAAAAEGEEPVTGEVMLPHAPPDMERLRRFWQVPFVIGLGSLVLSGLWMSASYGSPGFLGTLSFICGWSVFMLAVLTVGVAFWSRSARWVHLRVAEKDGHHFAISLPAPLGLLTWGVQVARPFVKGETAQQMEAAAAFIQAMQKEMEQPDSEPLFIDVNDEGDQVQVYFG